MLNEYFLQEPIDLLKTNIMPYLKLDDEFNTYYIFHS